MGTSVARKQIEPVHKTREERQYWLLKDIIPHSEQYPAQLKFAAVMKYAVCGSIREVERAINVPRNTIRTWMNSRWWPEAYRKAEEFQSARISAKFTQLANSAVDKLQAKVDEGELLIVRDKNGKELVRERVELSAKTLLEITKAAAGHLAVSQDVRKQELPQAPNLNNRLLSLAEDCVKVQQAMAGATAKTINSTTTNDTQDTQEDDIEDAQIVATGD